MLKLDTAQILFRCFTLVQLLVAEQVCLLWMSFRASCKLCLCSLEAFDGPGWWSESVAEMVAWVSATVVAPDMLNRPVNVFSRAGELLELSINSIPNNRQPLRGSDLFPLSVIFDKHSLPNFNVWLLVELPGATGNTETNLLSSSSSPNSFRETSLREEDGHSGWFVNGTRRSFNRPSSCRNIFCNLPLWMMFSFISFCLGDHTTWVSQLWASLLLGALKSRDWEVPGYQKPELGSIHKKEKEKDLHVKQRKPLKHDRTVHVHTTDWELNWWPGSFALDRCMLRFT